MIALCAAGLKAIIPLKLPTVAYCSILGLLAACPISPISKFVIDAAGKINFTAPLTMAGAYAGMSISNQLKAYEPHQTIPQKDTPLVRIGILVRGTFRVVNELENGNVFMIEINDAPSFVGEVTLLAGETTTSVTIESVTQCLVAYLPVEVFSSWLDADPALLRFVSSHVAHKLYFSSYNRGERNFYSAKYILLKYILKNIVPNIRLERSATSASVVRKTRQHMREEIGMSINTINRNLLSFRKDGLISMEHGKITITSEQEKKAKSALEVYIVENRNGVRNHG